VMLKPQARRKAHSDEDSRFEPVITPSSFKKYKEPMMHYMLAERSHLTNPSVNSGVSLKQ
jgi:hypothetical protein